MAKQKTKEELVKENSALTAEIQSLNKLVDFIKDENKKKAEDIRKEFAKALGLYEEVREFGYSSSTRKHRDLSWCEIFTEVGKLLNAVEFKAPEEIKISLKDTLSRRDTLERLGLANDTFSGEILGTAQEQIAMGQIVSRDSSTGMVRRALPSDKPKQ